MSRAEKILAGLLLLAAVVLGSVVMVGCGPIRQTVEQFLVANPDVAIVEVDDDGDGLPEAMGIDKDGDGVVDVDAAGKNLEVPGTRAMFADADTADTNISNLLMAFGFPGVAAVGAIWRSIKVTKRLTVANARSGGLIKSFDVVRTAAKDGDLSFEKINELLYEAQKQFPGLIDAIAATKTAIKKAELDGKQA